MTAYVELDRVSLSYDRKTLTLRETSFSVEAGEFVAVVGPSGCGKSSLMRLMTGLHKPSRGAVRIMGKTPSGPIQSAGMAFQNPNLLPWRRIMDNIMLPIEITRPRELASRTQREGHLLRARELLELVGLEGTEQKFPWELSGGMQQRAQLCRALIHEPSLLMLDEPFSALDSFTREELWVAMRDLWLDRRPTVVLVTHDLREAVFLADRILIMGTRPGRIISDKKVPLAHPRSLDDTYTPEAVDLVQELRALIGEARRAA